MLIALWILNGLLAVVYLFAGATKLARPRAALVASGMPWAEDFSTPAVKAIAALEVVGAFGLVLPLLLSVVPLLTPLASVGLAIIMIGAAIVHVRRKESPVVQVVITLLTIVSAILGFVVVLG